MNDSYMAMALRADTIQFLGLFESCIKKYCEENHFRVYINPTDFSEYARTFKVIKTKKRKGKRK